MWGKLTVIDIEGEVPETRWFSFQQEMYDLVWNTLSQAQPEMDCDCKNHES
jgi:hypothetical protein